MRITIVAGFFLPVPPVAGGAMEKIWWRLAREFATRGHEVTLFSRQWPGWPSKEVRDGVRLHRLPGFDHRRSRTANLLRDACWGVTLHRHLPAADILITNTIALPLWIHPVRPRTGQLVVNLNRFPKGQLRWYRGVARLQAASPAIAAAAVRQAPHLRDVVRIFPNPIDRQQLTSAAAQRQRPPHPVVLGYHGRIHPDKGLLLLVRAATLLLERADLPEWRLELRGPVEVAHGGGGATFLAQLNQAAARLGSAGRYCRHPPEFDETRLAAAYADADVFCYPTTAETGEALPVAVLEAMAARRPVIVTDLACFQPLVRPDVTGLLLPNWEEPTAAGRLAELFAALIMDGPRRDRLGAAASAAVAPLDFPVAADTMLADFGSLHHAV